jgi:DNA-binding NarL/FixJ family response regulator
MPMKILVVDDHSIVRDGLAVLLSREVGLNVVGTVATGEEAVQASRRLMPDIVVMDLVLPRLNGIEATRRIVRELPLTRVIVLSGSKVPEHVNRSMRAGARAYVLKTAMHAELLHAIEEVAAGRPFVSPAISLVEDPGRVVARSPFENLSDRERDVLRRIVAGATSADIARKLSLSSKTVETYRARMMVKLGVANRAALIRLTLEYELPSV